MKKLFILLLFIITLTGCQVEEKIINETAKTENKDYVLFTLNTHDWVNAEKSAEAVLKTIAIHEKYQVPVDIYLTDAVLQNYLTDYPEVIDKLKNSEVVSVSYHLRAPSPYNGQFDFLLNEFNKENAQAYEEHRLDLETGKITEEEGGYELLKKTVGYAPVVVGAFEGDYLEEVYAEKGATFRVMRRDNLELGDKNEQLYLRPEDVEIKWYEENRAYMHNDITAEKLINKSIENLEQGSGLYINIKMHENNYYTDGTPWWPVYYTDDKKTKALRPPYDLSAAEQVKMRPADYTESMWQFYESGVAYIAEHPELFETVNCLDLKNKL